MASSSSAAPFNGAAAMLEPAGPAALPLYAFDSVISVEASTQWDATPGGIHRQGKRTRTRRKLMALVAPNQCVSSLGNRKSTPDLSSHLFQVGGNIRAVVGTSGYHERLASFATALFCDNHTLIVRVVSSNASIEPLSPRFSPETPVFSSTQSVDATSVASGDDSRSFRSVSGSARTFRWLAEQSKRITTLAFNDTGDVLSATTLDGTLYLLSVDDMIAKADAVLFRDSLTKQGLPSLAAIARNKMKAHGADGSTCTATASPTDEDYPDVQVVTIPLFQQLRTNQLSGAATPSPSIAAVVAVGMDPNTIGALVPVLQPDAKAQVVAIGGSRSGGLDETPTCAKWFRPARSIIADEMRQRTRSRRGSASSNTAITISAFERGCYDRYLLLGHCSGRFTMVDTTPDVRSVVLTTLLDAPHPIRALEIFSDVCSLRRAGLWSFSSACAGEGSEVTSGDFEAGDATPTAYQPPTSVQVPDCAVVVGTDRSYFRLVLEKAADGPCSSSTCFRYTRTLLDSAAELIIEATESKDYLAAIPAEITPIAQHLNSTWQSITPRVFGERSNASAIIGYALLNATTTSSKSHPIVNALTAVLNAAAMLTVPSTVQHVFSKSAVYNGVSLLPVDTSNRCLPDEYQRGWDLSTGSDTEVDVQASTSTAPNSAQTSGVLGFFSSMFGFAHDSKAPKLSLPAPGTQRIVVPSRKLVEDRRHVVLPFLLFSEKLLPSRLAQAPRRCTVRAHVTGKSPIISIHNLGEQRFRIFDPSLDIGPLHEMLLPTTEAVLKFGAVRNMYTSLMRKLQENGKNYMLTADGELVPRSEAAAIVEEPLSAFLNMKDILKALDQAIVNRPLRAFRPRHTKQQQRKDRRAASDAESASQASDGTDTPLERDRRRPAGRLEPRLPSALRNSNLNNNNNAALGRKDYAASRKFAARKRYGSASSLASPVPSPKASPLTSPLFTRSNEKSTAPVSTEVIMVGTTFIVYTDTLIFIAENPMTLPARMPGPQDEVDRQQSVEAPPTIPEEEVVETTGANGEAEAEAAGADTVLDASPSLSAADSDLVEASPMLSGRTARTSSGPSALQLSPSRPGDAPGGDTQPPAVDDTDDFSDDEDAGTSVPQTLVMFSMSDHARQLRTDALPDSSFMQSNLNPYEPTFAEPAGRFMHANKPTTAVAAKPQKRVRVGPSQAPLAKSVLYSLKEKTVLEEDEMDAAVMEELKPASSAGDDSNALDFHAEAIRADNTTSELSSLLTKAPEAIKVAQKPKKLQIKEPETDVNDVSVRSVSPTHSVETRDTVDDDATETGDWSGAACRCATVTVVSMNMASRSLGDSIRLDTLLSKLGRLAVLPPEMVPKFPKSGLFRLPTDSILQRFVLPEGEVILDIGAFSIPNTRAASKLDSVMNRSTKSVMSVHVLTTAGAYQLRPENILDPAGLVRRLILEADLGTYAFGGAADADKSLASLSVGLAGFDEDALLSIPLHALEENGGKPQISTEPKLLQPLAAPVNAMVHSKVAAAERVSFALKLDARHIFEDMADAACVSVFQLGENGGLRATHPLFRDEGKTAGALDVARMSVADIKAAAAAIVAAGGLDGCLRFATGNPASLLSAALQGRSGHAGQPPLAKSTFENDVLPTTFATPGYLISGSNNVVSRGAVKLSPSQLQELECTVETPALSLLLSHPLVTALLLRAYALYTLSMVSSPLKPLVMLTQAGRPDLAVAFAAGALGFAYLYPCAARGLAPPLPGISFLESQLNPADRRRVANMLIQCQILAWPARTRFAPAASPPGAVNNFNNTPMLFDTHAYSYAMSPADFLRWLALNSEYSAERAIPWLMSNGMVYEALVVAHEKHTGPQAEQQSNHLMMLALTSACNWGLTPLTEDARCLLYLADKGYSDMLLSSFDGAVLKNLSPINLIKVLLATKPHSQRQHLIAQHAPTHLGIHVMQLPVDALLALTEVLQPVEDVIHDRDRTCGLLYEYQNDALSAFYESLNKLVAEAPAVGSSNSSEYGENEDRADMSGGRHSLTSLHVRGSRVDFEPASPMVMPFTPKWEATSPSMVTRNLRSDSEVSTAALLPPPPAQQPPVDHRLADQQAVEATEFFLCCLLAVAKALECEKGTAEKGSSPPLSSPLTSRKESLLHSTGDWSYVRANLIAHARWYRPHVVISKAVDYSHVEGSALIAEMAGDFTTAFSVRIRDMEGRCYNKQVSPAEAFIKVLHAVGAAADMLTCKPEEMLENVRKIATFLRRALAFAVAFETPADAIATALSTASTACKPESVLATHFHAVLGCALFDFVFASNADLEYTKLARTVVLPPELATRGLHAFLELQRPAEEDDQLELMTQLFGAVFPLSAGTLDEAPPVVSSADEYIALVTTPFETMVEHAAAPARETFETLDPDKMLLSLDAVRAARPSRGARPTFAAALDAWGSRSASKRAQDVLAFSCGHVISRATIFEKWLPVIKRKLSPNTDLPRRPTAADIHAALHGTGADSAPVTYMLLREEYLSNTPQAACPECVLREL